MTLEEIDELRAKATAAVENRRRVEERTEATCPECGTEHIVLINTTEEGDRLEAREAARLAEAAAEQALKVYWAQPDCPFCRHKFGWATAKLEKTGTAGRLECERCGAQALVGHCEPKAIL